MNSSGNNGVLDDPLCVRGIHPALFIRPILGVGFWAAVAAAIASFTTNPWATRAGWVAVGLATLGVVRTAIVLATHRIVLTPHRIVTTSGVLSRHTTDLHLAKVESVFVSRSLWGRIFGYGDILFTGSGGAHHRFGGVRDPDSFRDAVSARITQRVHRG